jgi:protein-S-isoprenylcysteine O-methyltransferase Ste14
MPARTLTEVPAMLELVGEFLLSFFIEPILDGVIAPLLAPTFKQESSLRTNSIRLVITLILNSAIAGGGGWLLFESATTSPVSGAAIIVGLSIFSLGFVLIVRAIIKYGAYIRELRHIRTAKRDAEKPYQEL